MTNRIITTLGRNVLCAALFAVSFLITHLTLGDVVATPRQSITSQAKVSPVDDLVGSHDCWTGEAPPDMKGVLPGHVVVTTLDGRLRYAGTRMVGKALDQLSGDVEHGLTVHAFCR